MVSVGFGNGNQTTRIKIEQTTLGFVPKKHAYTSLFIFHDHSNNPMKSIYTKYKHCLAPLSVVMIFFSWAVQAQSQADLSVSVFGAPQVIFSGQNVGYTLIISNAGPDVAVNLWIADAVPAETTFVSSTPSPLLNFPNQIAISIGSLAAESTTNVTVTFQTSETGSVTNYVYVFADTFDPVTTNNVAIAVNTVSDSLYASLSAFADSLGAQITNNNLVFFNYTNWASTNFASQDQLNAAGATFNSLISSYESSDAAAYGALAATITNNLAFDTQNLLSASNIIAQAVFGPNGSLFDWSATNGVGLYGIVTNLIAAYSNSILATVASTYQTATADAALATMITNQIGASPAALDLVSNVLAGASFGGDTNTFAIASTNGIGLAGLLNSYLAAASNSILVTVANNYQTISSDSALANLVNSNAAADALNLGSLSNALVQAGFGSDANFVGASVSGIGLYGMLTNGLALTSNSVLAAVAAANQTATAVSANLSGVSNLLAQAGFGNATNIFNVAATNGAGLYGLITNYLATMSNSIVVSVANTYQTTAVANSTYQTLAQAATVSNAISANSAALYSTYSYLATNRLGDNEQTLSPCANGVASFSTQQLAYSTFLSFVSQSWHTNFQNADSIRLVYSTSSVGWPGGETYVAGTSPFDLVAAVGYVQNGVTNWVVARWGGSEIVLVNPNSKITSDDIGITIPAGGVFMVRTWCNRDVDNTFSMPDGTRGLLSVQGVAFPVSTPYFRGSSSFLNNGNGVVSVTTSVAGSNPFTNTPFTLLTSPAPIAGSANQAFYPCAILGHSKVSEQTNVVIIGDSIANGAADQYDIRPDGGVGYVREAVFGSYGYVQLTAGGEKFSHWLNDLGAPARGPFILGAGRIICELGSNDAASGTNLVALQAEAVAVWSRLAKAGGGRVWANTLAPRSVSSDFFATTNNQTPLMSSSFTVIRNTYNDWLRAGAPLVGGIAATNGAPGAVYAGQIGHPLSGAFDSGAACEPYPDAGIWTAPPTNVYVGVATTATASNYTDSTAHWSTTANCGLGQMAGLVLVNLTHRGAAVILSNTTNTLTFWSGQTISGMTNGDNVKIFGAATFDGVHPLPAQNQVMAAAIPPSALR